MFSRADSRLLRGVSTGTCFVCLARSTTVVWRGSCSNCSNPNARNILSQSDCMIAAITIHVPSEHW